MTHPGGDRRQGDGVALFSTCKDKGREGRLFPRRKSAFQIIPLAGLKKILPGS